MCSKGVAKCFLFVFNSIFFLLGVAILAIGIVVIVDDSLIMQALSYVPSNDIVSADDIQSVLDSASFLESAAIAIIVLGSVVFIIGFCGCVGAVKESKCLLGIYGGLVLVILIAQLVAGVLAYVYQEDAENYLKDYLDSTIEYSYIGTDLDSNGDIQISSDLITSAWDLAQVTFSCCGVDGYADWTTATNWIENYTVSGTTFTAVVPPTCCMMTGADNFPSGLSDISLVDGDGCMRYAWTNATNTAGCYTSVRDLVHKYAIYIAGGGIGIALIEVSTVSIAFWLCGKIRNGNKMSV